MIKLLGLIWLAVIALYGILTVSENNPEIANWFIGTGTMIGILSILKSVR